MRAAAQFLREIAHRYDADALAVFFAEQSHRPGCSRIVEGHDICADIETLADLFIDDPLHLPDLFRRHRLKMHKVKAQPVRIHVGAFLLHVVAEHLLQGGLEQMGRAVVVSRRTASCGINAQLRGITHAYGSGYNDALVADFAAAKLDGFSYFKTSRFRLNDACVADLAAHG